MKIYFTNKRILFYSFILFLFNAINVSYAQTTWTGSVDTNFLDTGNWNTVAIPTASDDVVIAPATNNPILNADLPGGDIKTLAISTGGDLTISGNMSVLNTSSLGGSLTVDGGESVLMNFEKNLNFGITGNPANVTLNSGTLQSKTILSIGDSGDATFNVNGGILYGFQELKIGNNVGTGVLNINGGLVGTVLLTIGTNGTIHISGINGSLGVSGDKTTLLNNYIANGKITSPANTTLEVFYNGSITTVGLPRLIKDYSSYIILDSGPLQARIDKSSGEIKSLKVNGVETVATSNPANSGRVGTYYDLTTSDTNGNFLYERFGGANFTIKEETEDYIDVSFKRDYAPGKGACDMDIHYVLKKNDTGIYTYSILTHKPEYPDFPLGSWRQVLWLGNDGTEYLTEKIYVTEKKNWEMPSLYDWSQSESSGIAEFSKLTTGVQAGQYDGKYEYCENLYDLPVYGHASDVNSIGTWAVFGNHEFFPAGPTSHDLNAAAGIIHIDMTNVHYNSRQTFIPNGEQWSKIYGPYLWYTSEKPTGDENWADAKARAEQDKAEWPFAWLTDTPEYPLAEGRGNIIGNFSITDSEKPGMDGSNAWIGVTELSDRSDGDWQFEDKNYQYWVKTDTSGNFDIKHIRPGTYTLFAFKDGEIDEYRMENVTVTAGETTNLGNLNWTIPRNNGNLVWEIGIPNRTTKEFKFGDLTEGYESGDLVYSEGYCEYSFKDYFTNPIEYNVADKNWSDALPYAHTKYIKSDGSRDAWNWNLNFELTGNIPLTGSAKFTVAFASADYAQFWLYANGQTIYQTYLNGVPAGGNALVRQSNHAKYGIQVFDIPYNKLKIGQNTITLLMPSNQNPSHLMYDYISLEGNLTATLGTNDFDKNVMGIKIFPNPASESIHVKIENENFNSLTLSVYDLLGKQLIKTTPIKSISNTYTIDIKNKLISGMYIVKIDTENGNYMSKVVIK